MAVNARTRCIIEILRNRGILHPHWTITYARRYKVPLSIAAAVLIQESAGGKNIFGHDPPHGIGSRLDGLRLRWLRWIQGRRVTRQRYRRYVKYRKLGYGMQGVGPMQLTWYEFQNEADELGGAWKAEVNIRYGLKALGRKLANADTRAEQLDAIASYNGSGTAARRYAAQVKTRADNIHAAINRNCD